MPTGRGTLNRAHSESPDSGLGSLHLSGPWSYHLWLAKVNLPEGADGRWKPEPSNPTGSDSLLCRVPAA